MNNPYRRTVSILAALVSLPLIALVPAFLASQLFGEPQSIENDISQLTTVALPDPELDGATVMLNPSITKPVPSHLPMYYADIIRNGVLIREDFVRPGDVIPVGPLDAFAVRNLPTDDDECATILQLYSDEIAEQPPGWYLDYVLVIEEDTSTLHRCSIPEID